MAEGRVVFSLSTSRHLHCRHSDRRCSARQFEGAHPDLVLDRWLFAFDSVWAEHFDRIWISNRHNDPVPHSSIRRSEPRCTWVSRRGHFRFCSVYDTDNLPLVMRKEENEEWPTSRDTATPTSRPVDMIHRNYNPNPAFNARPR